MPSLFFYTKKGDVPAKYIAQVLAKELGWNKNTTYALIPKKAVQEAQINELIDKIYDDSADKLFAAQYSNANIVITINEGQFFFEAMDETPAAKSRVLLL